jgi:hypothetical protein
MPSALYALGYFLDMVLLNTWAGLYRSLPPYASCVAGMTGMCHHTQLLLVEMNFLPGLASNHEPPDLCLLSSWEYRLESQWLALSLYVFIYLFI